MPGNHGCNAVACHDVAARYAAKLLAQLGETARPCRMPPRHPAQGWAESGLMHLTGIAGGPPDLCPTPLPDCADGVIAALDALATLNPLFTSTTSSAPARAHALGSISGAGLLTERAALYGHTRQGATSPGGSCHLLEARDGVLALNLARDEDRDLLPAWLEIGATDWSSIAAAIASRPLDDLIGRGRLLGLALAPVTMPGAQASWFTVCAEGPMLSGIATAPLVVDLASLWAGPLCSRLLQILGARVLKVESVQRPDGARRGHPAFYDLLNAGKESIALDFRSAEGRNQLCALIAAADIVIEGSRPRALRQLGIDAETWVRTRGGRTWISITGYGRTPPEAEWVAFGDDAAVAAGLSGLYHQSSGHLAFCGDAIGDPLTGMHAALLAWSSHCRGRSRLYSIALRDVVAHCLDQDRPPDAATARARREAWLAHLVGQPVAVPVARRPAGAAAALGEHTRSVLMEFGIPC
ncbi:MAG: CoA transferase [Proteobacteria bacterium]|nr:CoA transferase [Pseudomonadota bacterium]HQR02913.1 CoA transferase [Rhodocyclaceae bacterium]